MSVVMVVAFGAALLCYWGSGVLDERTQEALAEVVILRSLGDKDQEAEAAETGKKRYALCCSLCRVGAWVTGVTAYVAAIYCFLY